MQKADNKKELRTPILNSFGDTAERQFFRVDVLKLLCKCWSSL